jgi:hypothetical protein
LAPRGERGGAARRPVAKDGIRGAFATDWGRRCESAVDGRCPCHGSVGLTAFAEGDECDGLADERVGLIAGDSSGAAVGIDGTTKFCGVAIRGAEMTVTDGHLPRVADATTAASRRARRSRMVAATCWTGGSEGRADATEATAGETVLFDEKKPGTTTG